MSRRKGGPVFSEAEAIRRWPHLAEKELAKRGPFVAPKKWSAAVQTTCPLGHRHASKMEARVCNSVHRDLRADERCFLQVRWPLLAIGADPRGRPLYLTPDFTIVGADNRIRRVVEARLGRGWAQGVLMSHLGAVPPSSACAFCPHRPDVGPGSREEIRRTEPETWAEVVAFDRAIRNGYGGLRSRCYLSEMRLPVEEAIERASAQGYLFGQCGREGPRCGT